MEKWIKNAIFIVLGLTVLVVVLALASSAFAQVPTRTVYPSYDLVNENGDHIMFIWEEGDWVITEFGDIARCCNGSCELDESPVFSSSVVEIENISTPTSISPTVEPTVEPTVQPTVEPTVEPTPLPTESSCNRGLGNGSEGCDPGNSGGKPGRAGEGDG